MCEGTIKTANVTYDPDNYMPQWQSYTLWPNRIYMLFGADLKQRSRRAVVSVGLTVGEYLVGLTIAAVGGFIGLYVTTPAIYVLCIAFGFYMGRTRWLTELVPEVIKCLRPVFTVKDDDFRAEIAQVFPSGLWRVGLVLLTAATMLATWTAVFLYYNAPTQAIRNTVSALVAPTFPAQWRMAPALGGKMIVIDLYLGLTCALGVPLVVFTVKTLVFGYYTLRGWGIVPLPAYVASALRPLGDFLFWAASYYAVGVTVFALVYAGKVSALYISVTAILSLAGLGPLLLPYFGFRRFIDQAREQLGEDVAMTLYQDVLPLTQESTSPSDDAARARTRERYAELLQLQQLMHSSGEDTGLAYRIDQILSGAFIQLAPTLVAIAIVALLAPGHLLNIFVK
jgi:hypothetical protein